MVRYIDFDQMEYTPEIASRMDIYADELTTYSVLRPMLNIKCPNEELKDAFLVLRIYVSIYLKHCQVHFFRMLILPMMGFHLN